MKLDKEDQVKVENHIRNTLGDIILESSIKSIFNNGIVSKEEFKINQSLNKIKLSEFINKSKSFLNNPIVLKSGEILFEHLIDAFNEENAISISLSNIYLWNKELLDHYENYSKEDFRKDLESKINLISVKEYKNFLNSDLFPKKDKVNLLNKLKYELKNQDLIFKESVSNYISLNSNLENLVLSDLLFLKSKEIQTDSQLQKFLQYTKIQATSLEASKLEIN